MKLILAILFAQITVSVDHPALTPLPTLDPHRLVTNVMILDGLYSPQQTNHAVVVCIRDKWPDTPSCNQWARIVLKQVGEYYIPDQEAK